MYISEPCAYLIVIHGSYTNNLGIKSQASSGNNAVTSSSTDLMNIGEIQRNFGKHCDSFSQRKINLPVSINWSWKTRKL
jgi:hypothetical protein